MDPRMGPSKQKILCVRAKSGVHFGPPPSVGQGTQSHTMEGGTGDQVFGRVPSCGQERGG